MEQQQATNSPEPTTDAACWVITCDRWDGSQRMRFKSHDPQQPGLAEVRQRIANDPQKMRFRMRRHGRILYTGLYAGPINRQKLREPLVMIGAPLAQCWDIEYRSANGKWERA